MNDQEWLNFIEEYKHKYWDSEIIINGEIKKVIHMESCNQCNKWVDHTQTFWGKCNHCIKESRDGTNNVVE